VGWPIDHSSSVILKKSVLKLMDRTVYALYEQDNFAIWFVRATTSRGFTKLWAEREAYHPVLCLVTDNVQGNKELS
jgi:hypothetical protein